ncbi:MAG: hypothetical protein JRG71_02615 [Deltaproteobacteria bacterium]|nr:hypothetical protein [Deltaproteobacteria bacterium]
MVLLRIVIAVVLCQLLLAGCSVLETINSSDRPSLEECSFSLIVENQKIV